MARQNDRRPHRLTAPGAIDRTTGARAGRLRGMVVWFRLPATDPARRAIAGILPGMKQAVVELSDDLVEGLARYRLSQDPALDLSAIVRQAIREFLAGRGLLQPSPGLRITPAERGSGLGDLSTEHDRYFTE
jgi:hypothetical protein